MGKDSKQWMIIKIRKKITIKIAVSLDQISSQRK